MFRLLKQNQKLVLILLIFISFAYLLAIADRAPLHLEKNCPCIHFKADVSSYINGIIHTTSPGPYVYRIFIPYLAIGLYNIVPSLSLVDIDLILKILFIFLSQLTLYLYLRNFFRPIYSLLGVFILDILLSFTFSSILGPSIGENADLFNLIIFILALNAIYKNSFYLLLAILFIGTFNRETTIFLLPILFINDYTKRMNIYRSILACVVVAIPYFGLRFIIQSPEPNWLTFEGLIKNIPFLNQETTMNALMANIHTFFTLGALIVLSLTNFSKHPQFLRIAFSIVPLFILLHYIFGSVIETRLWIPLFAILIPLSIDTINILVQVEPNALTRANKS